MVLVACGGGGAIDGYDVQAAYQALVSTDRSWVFTGTGTNGDEQQQSITTKVTGTTAFPLNGKQGLQTVTTFVSTQNGQTDSGTWMDWHDATTGAPIGSRREGQCTEMLDVHALPSGARPGDSGMLYRVEAHESCAPSSPVAYSNDSYRWSIDRIDGITFLCRSVKLMVVGEYTIVECYELTPESGIGGHALRYATLKQPGSNDATVQWRVKNY
jgi:hypothetical protein